MYEPCMKHFINHDIYHARNQMTAVLDHVMNQIIDHGINHAKQHFPKIALHTATMPLEAASERMV